MAKSEQDRLIEEYVAERNKDIGKISISPKGEYLVDLDIHVENQDGLKMVPGSATVQLPSKNDFKLNNKSQITYKAFV